MSDEVVIGYPELARRTHRYSEADQQSGTSAVWYKDWFDRGLATCLLVMIAPVVAILWALVRMDGGSGFYSQARVGRHGRIFRCWKLRTMVRNSDAVLAELIRTNPEIAREWKESQKLRNDPRVTLVGRFLRATSLDELPQIWNVLNGDMSFVGPRPVVPDELQRYGESARDYLSVKPGITGLWQVSGRNKLSYEERVRLDSFYVQNWSFRLDIIIVWRTVGEVLWWRSGI